MKQGAPQATARRAAVPRVRSAFPAQGVAPTAGPVRGNRQLLGAAPGRGIPQASALRAAAARVRQRAAISPVRTGRGSLLKIPLRKRAKKDGQPPVALADNDGVDLLGLPDILLKRILGKTELPEYINFQQTSKAMQFFQDNGMPDKFYQLDKRFMVLASEDGNGEHCLNTYLGTLDYFWLDAYDDRMEHCRFNEAGHACTNCPFDFFETKSQTNLILKHMVIEARWPDGSEETMTCPLIEKFIEFLRRNGIKKAAALHLHNISPTRSMLEKLDPKGLHILSLANPHSANYWDMAAGTTIHLDQLSLHGFECMALERGVDLLGKNCAEIKLDGNSDANAILPSIVKLIKVLRKKNTPSALRAFYHILGIGIGRFFPPNFAPVHFADKFADLELYYNVDLWANGTRLYDRGTVHYFVFPEMDQTTVVEVSWRSGPHCSFFLLECKNYRQEDYRHEKGHLVLRLLL